MLFSKSLYEVIKNKQGEEVPVKGHRWLTVPLMFCIIPTLFLVVMRILTHSTRVMNALVFRVTTPFKHTLSALFAHLPFAVAELVWAVALVALVVFVVRTVYLLIRRKGRGRRLLRRVLALVSAGVIVYSCYTVMWGINYYADDFSKRSGLTPRGCTVDELYQLTATFADQCNQLSAQMPRNSAGVTDLNERDLFPNSSALYAGVQEEFACLAGKLYDPKPMIFSKVITMTGFTGFYFPMTAESLVNIDQSDCMIPSTILHEMAHQCNVAEEDAANFVAILSGLHCDNVQFQYSSALLGYIHLSNALNSADKGRWQLVYDTLNEQVRADLEDNNSYWARYESPVSETSEKVYTAFLRSYGQTDGMKSYGQCIDLIAAYYLG